mgnify:CR=1 FL=1
MKNQSTIKAEFSKLFLKRNGKLYSCMIPRFLKQFTIGINPNTKVKSSLIDSNLFSYPKITPLKLDRTLLIRNSEIDLTNSLKFRLKILALLPVLVTRKKLLWSVYHT